MFNLLNKMSSIIDFDDKYDKVKTISMGACFFIIIASYTIIREIKDSIFCLIVGQSFLPDAKNISSLIMIPLVLFYSWLSSKIRKEYLLIFYSLVYGIGGLVISYYMKDPIIGFYNNCPSFYRSFGWISYLFLEGFSPFLVSVLWAYFNSIVQPEELKNKYVYMILSTKIGGIISSGIAWMLMAKHFSLGIGKDEVSVYYIIMAIASSILLFIPIILIYMLYKVPNKFLKGYSDKNSENIEYRDKSIEEDGSGFKLLFKYPYILGIFGMLFFWEAINVVFNYMRLSIGLKESESISEFGAFLYKNAFLTHLVGFFVAAIGTSSLINIFGQRISLVLVPLFTGGAILVCLYFPSTSIVIFTYIFIRAINYSFAYPLRESLYIPTTDSIKFKAKSWIDSFGSKFSKTFGSLYNKSIQFIPVAIVGSFQFGFFLIIIFSWTFLANYMGKSWEKSIKEKKIIGKN